jgi:8-oxo-dGTP pyrophosphatase MutT (NUDIX family)
LTSPAEGPGDTLRPWRTLNSVEVYRNPWISVREDEVETPAGHRATYGVVTTGRAVGVLPFVDPDHVVLVRQWRYVTGVPTWEMPTGGAHADEDRAAAAQRELAEEAGYRAGRLEPLADFVCSKSILDETAHLFLGWDLTALGADDPAIGTPDPTERLEQHVLPFADVVDMVVGGSIVDAMTVVAVLMADRLRRTRPRHPWP